nr:MAG TPA: L1 Poxvirus entry protein complex L1 and I2 [Caudoviricetes sp.]
MDSYHDKFNKYFPTMCFMGSTDDEFVDMIDKCLKAGKSAEDLYKLDYKHNLY